MLSPVFCSLRLPGTLSWLVQETRKRRLLWSMGWTLSRNWRKSICRKETFLEASFTFQIKHFDKTFPKRRMISFLYGRRNDFDFVNKSRDNFTVNRKDKIERLYKLGKSSEVSWERLHFPGSSVGFVDLMIWPWFERLPAVQQHRQVPFNAEKHPKLTEWAEKMREHPQIKPSIYPTELHLQYLQTRNFNVGL